MSNKQKAKKDIEMAFDFARFLIDYPEELAKIPDGSEIAFNEKGKAITAKQAARKKQLRVDVKHAFEIKKKAA